MSISKSSFDTGDIFFEDNTSSVETTSETAFFDVKLGSSNLETKIYAFEPSPQEMFILKENIKHNGFKNIETLNKAIAEKEGKFNFYMHIHL